MNIKQKPFPILSIDNFIPSKAIVRAAAASFDTMDDQNWVKYGGPSAGQVQYCPKSREVTPSAALMVLDYIATNFDPNTAFNNLTNNAFPDTSYHGGGMMLTPNLNGEGGYLGMHVDAEIHKIHKNWVREYSAVLCLSEEYDKSFDLLVHNGVEHARLPYKFNTLNIFKCSHDSWHGFPEITKGMNRKTLGVMYWSITKDSKNPNLRTRAAFNNKLQF